MPTSYPLEDLGNENFERLCVALIRRLTGPGLEVFGRGPDGGREATFSGTIDWESEHAHGDRWVGYTVFQAKHRSGQLPRQEDGFSWLQEQIHREFNEWERNDSQRAKFPEYIAFISNAQLSSTSDTGGIDKINKYIERRWKASLRERGLKGWKVLHRDYIVTELNTSGELRAAFPGLLTAGDILQRLARIPLFASAEGMREFLVECESQSLKFDRWVNFAEAGGQNRTSIEKVVVDLPCVDSDQGDASTLGRIIARADQVLSRSLCEPGRARHLVLTGAPGNGKSTLTRFLAQLYRAAFLQNDIAEGMVSEIVSDIRAASARLSLRFPLNTRWPLFVRLTDIADSKDWGLFPFLRWVAESLNQRTQDHVTAGWLKDWLRTWPWLVVFDGLDEVTSIAARRRILDMIENFRDEVDAVDADALIIVTTRPTGYSASDRLPAEQFEQIDLSYLSAEQALEYGNHLTSIRLADDPDRAISLSGKLRKAVADETSTNLARTPLQILIMTIILERLGQLPSDRYLLFWGYYETIYSREAAKPLSEAATLLREHRQNITTIHTRVALELQHRSETEGEASAVMLEDRFEELIRRYLVNELGFPDDYTFALLVRRLREAAMTRLVLLGPRGEGIGFEVRPLQELMAARALSDVDDARLAKRLRVLAPSPHWRNTWLFMAGRIFSESQSHRWDIVTECVATIDVTGSWPGWLCPVGPGLAGQLLEDGIGQDKPRWRNDLLDVALRALGGPVVTDFSQIHRGLKAAIQMGDLARIRGAFKAKGDGPLLDKQIAIMLWSTNDFGGQILGWTRSRRFVLDWNLEGAVEEFRLGTVLKARVEREVLAKDRQLISEVGRLLVLQDARGRLSPSSTVEVPGEMPVTLAALCEPDRGVDLRTVVESLGVDQWAAKYAISTAVEPYLTRLPILPGNLGDWLLVG